MCDLSLDLHYDRQATGKIIRHRQNRWRFEEARGMARIAALFLSVALPLTLCRELSPNVFTTVFDMDERQLRPPLAVLRVNRPAGGATHPANINILDEDPHWALKVFRWQLCCCHVWYILYSTQSYGVIFLYTKFNQISLLGYCLTIT